MTIPIILLLANFVLGCSLNGKLLHDFDESDYIFIGEIIDYTPPVESRDLRRPATGLVVKIRESVYLPKVPVNNFEVFPFELWADCSVGGWELDDLKKKFPINSEIRVIAKEAKILPKSPNGGSFRLEERPAEIGGIHLNVDEGGARMTSATSIFDYKSFKSDWVRDSSSKYSLPEFEIRKDLLRLKNAGNQAQKNEILARLVSNPHSVSVDFRSIFDRYAANEVESVRYYEERLRLTDPPFFNLHLVEKYVFAELRKRKVSSQKAGKVFGAVLNEIMDAQVDVDTEAIMLGLDSKDVLERCLRVLKEKTTGKR